MLMQIVLTSIGRAVCGVVEGEGYEIKKSTCMAYSQRGRSALPLDANIKAPTIFKE